MDHISWRTRTPEFIPPVLLQLSNICWAIAFVRQFEMQLKMENLLSPHQHLSIQELVNIVPFRYRRRNGTIFGIEHAARFLRSIGTVLDEACPLTYLLNTRGRTQHPGVIRYKVPEVDHHYLVEYFAEYEEFGSDVFEDTLVQWLDRSPVTVRIPMCTSYGNTENAGGIYDPSPEEIRLANGRNGSGHFLLLMGAVISANGTQCWECQDSSGEDWGDGGFVLIRRKRNIVTEFHVMQVIV